HHRGPASYPGRLRARSGPAASSAHRLNVASVRRRESCRLCDGAALDQVLSLPPTPPANAFVKDPVAQDVFPQDLYRCRTCGHVQLGHVVDAETLFGEYVYASGTSPV